MMPTMMPVAPLLLCLTLMMILGVILTIPGGGSTNDGGSFSSFTTSASTPSKTPASYVSSSLTTRVSLLKSAADVVKCTDVDYATGSFCSSCSIPPLMAGGLIMEKDVLCATMTMTITVGVDLGFSW